MGKLRNKKEGDGKMPRRRVKNYQTGKTTIRRYRNKSLSFIKPNINRLRTRVTEHIIHINYNDKNSISKAEKTKTQLENKGYTLTETKQEGLNKYSLNYKWVGKKAKKRRRKVFGRR